MDPPHIGFDPACCLSLDTCSTSSQMLFWTSQSSTIFMSCPFAALLVQPEFYLSFFSSNMENLKQHYTTSSPKYSCWWHAHLTLPTKLWSQVYSNYFCSLVHYKLHRFAPDFHSQKKNLIRYFPFSAYKQSANYPYSHTLILFFFIAAIW